MKKLDPLFAAHHPDKNFIPLNCNHYYSNVLSIASMIKSPEHCIPAYLHSHEEYEFNIPLTPLPILVSDDAVFFGEVGFGYPIPPARQHGAKFNMADVAMDQIVCKSDYMKQLMKKKRLSGNEFNSRFPVTKELKSYIQLFKQEFEKGCQTNSDKLMHLSALICSTLIDLGITPDGRSAREPQQYQKGIHATVEYLNTNYQNEISIDDLAQMCGLTKNYFITSFKRSIGESPYSYLNKLRISKAKVLLETTTYSIQEIAHRCGFQRANTFSSLFKSNTGLTPTEYRQSLEHQN